MAENLLSDSDVWGSPAQSVPPGLLSDDDLWGTPKPKEQRGAVAEIGRQIVGGLVTRAPAMIGGALEWWAPQGSDLEDAGRVAKEYWTEKEKAWEPDLEGRGFVSSTLIKGATQLAPSMLGMGAAMINPALGAAAVTTLFGGQQAQSTYDKAIEAGLKEPEASMAAYKTGLIEAFGETVADVTGAKFLMGAGKLASGLLGKGTGEAIRAAINPAVAAKFARDWAANAVIQSGTEFGQGYGEAAVEKDAGISTEDPFSQGTEGAQSALGMSVLLGPLAAAGHVSAGRKRAMVGQALNDPSAPLPIRMAAGEYVAKDIEPSVGKEAAQSWLQSFHEAAVQDRDAQQQRAPAEFKDDQEATAPTGLLGYQAGPPLVVFPDGSTMTGAEAEQRRLDAMVQRAQPADILTAPDVDTAIAAAVDSVAAVTDAADEFADLQKQEESDLAYRRREVAENAAKAADFARAKQQQADITVDQANALTRVSGFDDQTPTAMQLALQRAQQQKTAAPAQTPASATPIKAQPEPVAAAPNVAAQPAPPVSVQRLDETAVAAAPNVDSYLAQNAAGKWQLSRPMPTKIRNAVIAEMDRRNQEGSTNAAQAAESPLPAVPQEARQGAPLPAEVANGSTNEPAPAPVPGQRGAILDDARQAVPQGASAAQAVPDAAAQDQGSDRGAVEPTNSLQRTASWVIKNKKTGEVVMETFDRKKVDALNTQKYVAVPIVEHLASIGRERISVPDLISESTNIGVNRDGKQIYENKRGRFVVRHDNKKYEPDGWTDFGGDLAPVEQTPPTPNESPAAQLGGTTPKVGAGETAMIGDFGSRIEGARKDYASKLKEAESADIASVPLSQSWPEPDYQKMLDAGSEPWAVAFMRASRDEVPTKPQSPWKLSRWVKQVAQLRDFAMRVVDGSMGADRVKEAMGADSAMKVIMDRIDLYTEVGHDKSLKGIRVSAGDYSVYEGVEYKPAKRIWSVEQKAAKTAFSNWPKMIATGDTREEAIANFKAKWLETSPDQDAKKAIDFSIYRKLAVNEFFVGKKIGKDVVPFKEGFKTALEARAWKDANQAELVKMLERFKDIPSERRENNSPRVGIDHRNGADVTMQQFAETFGFRGGQFGASMPQAERQSNLNETYDALTDMAGILGIPPKALSLNGELGLAFGARGKGGKGAFAAHYEADTTGKVTADRVVINLTRARGAGSLAHEWFHAVDNYFARKGGRAGAFQTELQRGEGVRPEMLDAFNRVMQAINSTSLKMRGRKLDQTRSKAYWSTGLEMAARSFESYIIAKLNDQNASNDYLANIVSEDYWNAAAALGIEKEGTYPYPTADEAPAIRGAFDHFFQTIETKETDTGIAFNSIAEFADPSKDEAERVQAGIEGKDIIGAAQWLVDNAPPMHSAIAAKVLASLKRQQSDGMVFEFHVMHPGDSVPMAATRGRGATSYNFDFRKNVIAVWINGADVVGKVGTSYETVLHELVHAATMSATQLAMKARGTEMQQHVFYLFDVTNAIMDHYGQRLTDSVAGKVSLTPIEESIQRGESNAFKTSDEVLAWALSSKDAQTYLETIPYKGKSAWTAFVEAIRKILGLQPRNDTALSEVLRVAEAIMEDRGRELRGLLGNDGVRHGILQPGNNTGFMYSGAVSNDGPINSLESAAITRAIAQESEQPTETQRGAGWLKIKLRQAQHNGDLSAEAVEMVEWLVKQNPALVKYLAVAIENPKVMEEGFNAVSSAPTFKAVIPRPQIPAKLSQREFSSILQDIDGYGPIAEDDPYRISELGAIVKKLKAAGVNHIDMYHVTDANLEDFKGDGVRGSEVDYIGRSGQNARASSVYGFLDPDDIKAGYPGVLGASSETPNVIHIRVPVDLIGGFRWDGNFNITYGAYSGVRYVGNIPSTWIEGAYRYDIAKNSVIATEFPQANPDISQSIDRPTGAAGNYNPFTQVMTLFRGNASDTTAIHEILHHLERMMPAEMQAEIHKEWRKAATKEMLAAMKAKDQPRIDYFKAVLAGDQKKATELLTGKGMEGFNAPPREESASKSVKRDMLKYPNMSFPLSMPQEMRDEILKWNAVSQSPYSESFYDITNKGWDNDPDSFLRVADHWAFESGGRIHAQTDIDVEPGNWTLAEHGPDGVYRVIKSVPRLPTDSAQYRENVARRSAEFEQKKRDAADLKDRIRKAIAKAIGTEIADDPASPLKGAGYQRRELGKTKEDKRRSALIGNLFPNHIEEIWATRSTKRDAGSPETYAIPLEKLEAAFAAKSAEARSGQEFNSIGFNAVEPAPTFKAVDTESAEFKRWFEGSAVTDSDGKPLRVYHWSMNGDITEFRTEATDQDIGAHFGSVVAANGRADNLQKTSGNIYAVFLSIKNPLRITDEQAGLGGGGWSGFDLLDRLIARKIFTQKEYSRAAGEYNKNETPGSRAWPFSKEARDFIRKKLEQNGYDGIVYSNQHEGNNGVGDGSDSYIAFRPEQIKSAISNTGAFDPSNPDILQDLAIGQDYQYLNPSEFWAVRMTSTMAARFEAKSIWARSLQWLKEALEHIKGALGLKSDHPLLKALDDLIKNGNGEFVSKEMLGSSEVYAAPRIIGDSGRQYTPDQEAMFKQTGREVDQGTVLGKLKEWAAANWRQGLFDQFQPARAISAHGYTLLRLSKGATGAFEALMGHGKLSIRDGAYDADTSGGVMQEVFFQLGKESTDFLYWIAGNRAERLAMEGKERLFSVHDIAAAKSLAAGTTDFDYALANGQTTRDRTLIYRDSLTKFNAFNKNVMDMAEQSGLIDAASRHLWEHEFYVPFYRVMDEKDGGVRGMNIKQGVVRQQAFKKLNGGKEGLNDLLANTLMNWAHLIDAAAKNRGAKETLEAAVRMGAAHPAVAGEKNTVWYMDGGKKVELTVDDPELMVAISALDYSGLRGIAMDALSKPKHWLTIGVTASPFFKIRNLIRDSVQAVATSGLSFNIAGNVAEGIKLTNRDRQEYVSALAGGGLIRFGTMLEGNEAARTRQLIKKGATDEHILDSESKVRRFYDKFLEPAVAAYNELGNRGEEINRMSLYDQLTKQGVDHATASLMARDLMDFSMQGSWTAIRFLAQIVPFFNARMQGMYKLGRAAKSDPAKFATVLGAVTMFSLALLAAYHDDDDWKKREEWDRDNYWWFKVGGVAFRIPKPFEIGAIATLAERSAELMFDDEMTGKRFRKVTTKLLADQLSMNPTPQLIKPIIDLYANKDSFSGRAIETMGMERVDSERRFNSGTSMPARGLSTAIGGALSPVQIDHLVRGYFAWLGAFTVGAADMAVRAASNEPTKPASDYWKVATGGMVAGLDGASSRYVSQMYDQAKEIEMAYNTYRDMLKTAAQKQGAAKTETLDEAKEYRESNADKLNRYRGIEGAKRRLSTINQRIKSIERGDMTADEKRQAIIGLNKQKDMVARQIAR